MLEAEGGVGAGVAEGECVKEAAIEKQKESRLGAALPGGLVLLIVGDILAFLLFAVWGRATHGEPLPLPAIVETAAPFLVAWLAVATLLGAYRATLLTQPLSMTVQTLIAWIAACVLGLYIRSAWLQREIILNFALVTFGLMAPILIGWRALFAWWNRSRLS